ncbi:MAG: helicase SNF2, partial [Planctomycetaceae bacterium]
MSLAKVLESRFRGDVRFRGQAYVSGERVEITHVTEERVYGVVHDGQEFQTQLSREDSQLVTFCTCAKPGQQDVSCKHVWATVLATEDQGYLSSPAKPGFFPPFTAIEDETDLDFDSDLYEDMMAGDVFVPTTAAKRTRKEAPKVEQPLTEWERRLKSIHDELDEGELSSATAREREIIYQLDLAACREHGQIVIDVVQRQRRANGAWGKVKPLKLKPGKLDEVEHEDDRYVLALMGGG